MPVRTLVVRIIVAIIALIGLYIGGIKVWFALHHETTDNAQVEARMVPILSRVSGYIKTLNVEDYSIVKKDSLLAVIDDSEYALQLAQMKADLLQAETDVENARASLVNAQATVTSAKSNLEVIGAKKEKALQDYQRDLSLFKDGAITQKQSDDSKANADIVSRQYDATADEVKVAQSRIAVSEAQLKKAQAIVEVKKSGVEQQELKLSYTKIYSTSDGKIGKRNIDVGQFVQAGTPLFTVVNDEYFWVIANFKETQLEHLKIGKEAIITLDAYPDLEIKGKIVSFSDATGAKFSLLPPDNATGNFVKVTQRIPVKIEIENIVALKGKLRAGMSLDVSVKY